MRTVIDQDRWSGLRDQEICLAKIAGLYRHQAEKREVDAPVRETFKVRVGVRSPGKGSQVRRFVLGLRPDIPAFCR